MWTLCQKGIRFTMVKRERGKREPKKILGLKMIKYRGSTGTTMQNMKVLAQL